MVAWSLDVLIAQVAKLACQRRKQMLPTLVNQNTELPGVRQRGTLAKGLGGLG